MTVDAHLYLEQSLETAEVLDFCGGRLAAFTAPRREGLNEDAALRMELDPGRGVLAVADGAGGEAAGGRASAAAVRSVLAQLEQLADRSLREAILSGFDDANHAVSDLGVGAATTLALVRLDAGTVRSYHVGDSVVLVVGQRGKRKLETIAHSPVGYAVEAGVLDETDALHHEERHVVSNLLGAPDMRVEMSGALKLAPRDTVLVASDGVSDNLHVDELVELIRKGPLAKVAARLAETALQRMRAPRETLPSKPDDLTFFLFRP
ncbi:MAG: PP2C family protein-serine/threonine phosphatase [Planctomycetota bacterium]|jgi:serine/threonine protein phosphatase PrpC